MALFSHFYLVCAIFIFQTSPKYGIEKYSVNDLAVNEQNPLAKGFYEHMGFEVYKRTECDEQGKRA